MHMSHILKGYLFFSCIQNFHFDIKHNDNCNLDLNTLWSWNFVLSCELPIGREIIRSWGLGEGSQVTTEKVYLRGI